MTYTACNTEKTAPAPFGSVAPLYLMRMKPKASSLQVRLRPTRPITVASKVYNPPCLPCSVALTFDLFYHAPNNSHGLEISSRDSHCSIRSIECSPCSTKQPAEKDTLPWLGTNQAHFCLVRYLQHLSCLPTNHPSSGDSYTTTGFNVSLSQPGPGNPLGNPTYP